MEISVKNRIFHTQEWEIIMKIFFYALREYDEKKYVEKFAEQYSFEYGFTSDCSSCICSVRWVYYEYYHLDGTEEIPVDYKEISFVCLRPDGCLELPSTLSIACRSVAKRLDGFENFHFHQLRHTYTSNLLSNGAAPKDVQELLGHSDVSTTMNVYAHSTRKAKRNSARLLDKVAGND